MALESTRGQGRNHASKVRVTKRQRRWDRDAEGVEGVGNEEGFPPPQPTRGPGERRKLP